MDYDILRLPCCSNTSNCKWRARWRRMQKAWVGWRRPRSMKLIILDIFHFTSKSGYFGHFSFYLKVGFFGHISVCVFWPYMIPPQSRNSMHLKVGVPPQILEQADATTLWVSWKSAPEQFDSWHQNNYECCLISLLIVRSVIVRAAVLTGICRGKRLTW